MTMSLHSRKWKMPIKKIVDYLDCKFIEIFPYSDERGYFYESFNEEIAEISGFNPKQESISKSKNSVIRGLHMQNNPPVSKMVRVLQGKIEDVIVDCRPESSTFGQHKKFEIGEDSLGWLFIPGGYSHGFEVISDFAIVNYMFSEKYNPINETTISVFDPDLGIKWKTPRSEAILSKKDNNGINLRDVLR